MRIHTGVGHTDIPNIVTYPNSSTKRQIVQVLAVNGKKQPTKIPYLHLGNVMIAQDPKPVIQPAVCHDRLTLSLCLLLALVADVPESLAKVVDSLVQLSPGLLVFAHVVRHRVVVLLPLGHKLLLVVWPSQVGQEIFPADARGGNDVSIPSSLTHGDYVSAWTI